MADFGSIVHFPARDGRCRERQVSFSRCELNEILDIYGRMVAAGVWRDYAVAMQPDRAVFAVFQRASEIPAYRIIKEPRRARLQGEYSVLARDGLVMKRGHSLPQVLGPLQAKLLKVIG